jgi:HlyD family secretion protein
MSSTNQQDTVNLNDFSDTLQLVGNGERWFVRLGLLLVVIAIGLGVWIKADKTVQGAGVILWSEGIGTAMSRYPGEVSELLVTPGTRVEKGQLVARLTQLAIARELDAANAALERAKQRHQETQTIFRLQEEREAEVRAQEEQALQERIKSAEELVKALDQQIAGESSLRKKGLISEQQVLATRTERNRARNELAQIRAAVAALSREALTAKSMRERELLDMAFAIDAAELDVSALKAKLQETSSVYAPVSGQVIELMVRNGQVVAEREPILRIAEAADDTPDNLLAYLFLPAGAGKKAKAGMTVRISPATAERERYGNIVGVVEAVSALPATSEGFATLSGQPDLLQLVSESGPPLQVVIRMTKDSSTPSGLKWTSSRGPDSAIVAGTFFTGSVVLEKRPVLFILFPFLQWGQ